MKKSIIVGFCIAILILSISAIPVLAVLVDGFEDGNVNEWSSTSGDFDLVASQDVAAKGNWSGKLEDETDFGEYIRDLPENEPQNVSFYFYTDLSNSGDATDATNIDLRDSSGSSNSFVFQVIDDGSIEVNTNPFAPSGTIEVNTWYNVEVSEIDYADNTLVVTVRDIDGNIIHGPETFGHQDNNANAGRITFQSVFTLSYIDHIQVNEEPLITPTPEPTPTPTPKPTNLYLNINNQWMDHNTKQIFNVEFVNGTSVSDVTQEATVQSSQPNNITVFQANETLLSTDNESINSVVTINASYQGHNDSVDIFVGNRTLENIEKCIGFTKITCGIGVDEPDNFGGLGSTIQWIYVIILFATGIGGAFKNPWIGLGMMILGIVLLFIIGEIDLGTTIASVFLGIYFGLILSQGESITVENFR